jgi:hypothetical protein
MTPAGGRVAKVWAESCPPGSWRFFAEGLKGHIRQRYCTSLIRNHCKLFTTSAFIQCSALARSGFQWFLGKSPWLGLLRACLVKSNSEVVDLATTFQG